VSANFLLLAVIKFRGSQFVLNWLGVEFLFAWGSNCTCTSTGWSLQRKMSHWNWSQYLKWKGEWNSNLYLDYTYYSNAFFAIYYNSSATMFIYCKYQLTAWKLTSLQTLHWALLKMILPYTSLHMLITLKNISDEPLWRNLKKLRTEILYYGMRHYVHGSVLPDTLKALLSLETSGIPYAMT